MCDKHSKTGDPAVGSTRLVGRLKCLCGLHQWKGYGANVEGDATLVTLVWWECQRCAASKLKCIYHNK